MRALPYSNRLGAFRIRRRRSRRRRPLSLRRPLRLEPLEDRTLLSITYVDSSNLPSPGSGTLADPFTKIQDGIDATHPDLNVVATISPIVPARLHGTHVAGILGASGVQSNTVDIDGDGSLDAPFQYRGVAPRVALIDSSVLDVAASLLSAIQNNSLDIVSRSQSISFNGNYDGQHPWNQRNLNLPAPPPGPAQIVAVGGQLGYFSLTKQMKNAIIVGNWDTGINMLSSSSSLGPTYDGRIKPDVVATVEDTNGNGALDLGEDVNGNGILDSGVIGALGVGGATVSVSNPDVDVDNVPGNGNDGTGFVTATVGPDYATGWGMVNAQAAVGLAEFDADIAFTWEVSNNGDEPAGAPFDYRILLSRDFYLRDDVVLSESVGAPIAALAVGASSSRLSKVRISQDNANELLGREPWDPNATIQDLLDRDVFLLVEADPADPDDDVLEHNEINLAPLQAARLVDVVMVMDRSGSMRGSVPVSGGSQSKIAILKDSAGIPPKPLSSSSSTRTTSKSSPWDSAYRAWKAKPGSTRGCFRLWPTRATGGSST